MFKNMINAINAAVVAFNSKEENTMNETIIDVTVNENNVAEEVKEETTMTAKERWMANINKGRKLGYEAAHKAGYGIGYGTTTVAEEAKYVARKVKTAIDGTTTVQEFKDGYYDGKNDAYMAFVMRAEEREYKAREKADAKAAKAAAEELFEETFC